MDKASQSQLQNETPCPICGGSLFTWGVTGPNPVFHEKEKNVAKRLFSHQQTEARRCDTCGNVLLFIKE